MFFTTLPGILTGLAALVGAVAVFPLVLGYVPGFAPHSPPPSPAASSPSMRPSSSSGNGPSSSSGNGPSSSTRGLEGPRGGLGVPAFIQGHFGTKGNFEVIVPLTSGGLAKYFRENDTPGLPWRGRLVFGLTAGDYYSAAMILSNFSSSGTGPGNFDVVAQAGDRLDHYFHVFL